jgi:flagellar biosynthetic protein FliS
MRGIDKYQTSRVSSAGASQVLIMLYEEVLKRIRFTRTALEQGNNSEAISHLGHTRAVFVELVGGLKEEVSPELVGQLRRIYDWAIFELIEVGRSHDASRLDAVYDVTSDLLESWRGAVQVASGVAR